MEGLPLGRDMMTKAIHVEPVRALFREEIEDLGGQVCDEVADGSRLFARSLLPAEDAVAPGDVVKSGVALRCTAEEIEVRPYVLRQICRNGAIGAQSALGRRIDLRGLDGHDSRMVEVRHAIRAAASREAFGELTGAMRASRTKALDFDLLLTMIRPATARDPRFLLDLMERITREGTYSVFAIGNALTSLARDTADPDLRWQREALGAAVFARLTSPVTARARSDALLQPQ